MSETAPPYVKPYAITSFIADLASRIGEHIGGHNLAAEIYRGMADNAVYRLGRHEIPNIVSGLSDSESRAAAWRALIVKCRAARAWELLLAGRPQEAEADFDHLRYLINEPAYIGMDVLASESRRRVIQGQYLAQAHQGKLPWADIPVTLDDKNEIIRSITRSPVVTAHGRLDGVGSSWRLQSPSEPSEIHGLVFDYSPVLGGHRFEGLHPDLVEAGFAVITLSPGDYKPVLDTKKGVAKAATWIENQSQAALNQLDTVSWDVEPSFAMVISLPENHDAETMARIRDAVQATLNQLGTGPRLTLDEKKERPLIQKIREVPRAGMGSMTLAYLVQRQADFSLLSALVLRANKANQTNDAFALARLASGTRKWKIPTFLSVADHVEGQIAAGWQVASALPTTPWGFTDHHALHNHDSSIRARVHRPSILHQDDSLEGRPVVNFLRRLYRFSSESAVKGDFTVSVARAMDKSLVRHPPRGRSAVRQMRTLRTTGRATLEIVGARRSSSGKIKKI